MIVSPWVLPLSAAFLATAVLYSGHLVGVGRLAASRGQPVLSWSPDTAVHVSHLVMSLAMLLMVWRSVGTAATWVQVAFFATLAVLLLRGLPGAQGVVERIDIMGHVVLNAAMVWMLLAMPALMGHAMSTSTGDRSGHDSHMSMSTVAQPEWVTTGNGVVIVSSVVIALWWASRFALEQGRRLSNACHLLMACGMAVMLAVM